MRTVLADVDATDVREVIVINKADLADPEVIDRLRRHEKHSIVVSARTGAGLDELRALIADELPQPDVERRRARARTTAATWSAASTSTARCSRASTRPTAPGCARGSTPDLAAELTAFAV